MAVTVADFRTKFPEFAEVADAEVTEHIEDAALIAGSSDRATLWCAAHLAALDASEVEAKADGGAGVIVYETTGPFSRQIKTQIEKPRDVFFAATKYGRRMLIIENRTPHVAIPIVT